MAPGLGNFLEEVEFVEEFSSALSHGAEWIVGNVDGQAGLFGDELIKSFEEGTPAREDDPPVNEISGEFGRAALERDQDRLDDDAERVHECLADLSRGNFDRPG